MHDELKNPTLKDSNPAAENDARLNLLYEIGRILASLETMNEAAPQILEAICRNLRFELGELWCLGKGETVLKLESVWHLPSPLLEKFVAESRRFEFAVGIGLPGKAWAKNAPVWLEDISGEDKMPRRFFAEETSLQSGFAFPILLGERFLGAFSFFTRDTRPADDALLQMFAAVGNHIGQFIKREKTESSLRESEDRYRAFIEQSTEGIWRFELDEKFSVNLPVEEQIKLAFERGYLAECNDAMARMYGLGQAEDLVGSRIADFLDMSDAANVEYIRSFIESGYNLTDAESHEKDADGRDKYFLNSLIGTIENGSLVRVWGTQRDVTEQKKAEQSLRESEENFRAFMQASSQAVWTTNADSQSLEAFGWWENQTGQTRDKSAGAGFLEAVHPEDRERVRNVWQNALAAIKSFETECRISDRHGDYQHFALRGVPVFNTDNSFRQWIGTLTDITDRKLAEQSLKDNEKRYRALVEATSTVVWRANESGELSFVGASWENVSGQRVEEILGSGWLDALHPDDRETTIRVWQHALASKNIYETEFRVLTTGGEYRWFAVRGVPILNGDGSVREWVGANTDITERKLAEEAVRESEESYRIVAETASDAVIKIAEDSRILFVNSAVERIFGYRVEEMVGESLTMIMPENLRERHRAGIQRYLETGERHLPWESMEIPALHADGHLFPLEISFGEYNQNGKRFFTGIARDITDRKRAENDLRESEENLRLATGAARMYSWELDLKTQVTRFGENFSRVVGLAVPISEMNAGKIFQELIHPDDAESSVRYIEHAAATTGSHSIETRLVNPDNGAIVWLETTSYTVRDGDGEPQRIVGVSQNITERKRAEETLLERERLAFLNSEIGETLIENNSLPDILHACTEIIVKHLDAAFARIWTFDKADDALHLQASSGIYTHLDGEHSRVPLGKYKIGLIAAERKPHLTNSVIGDARVNNQEWARRENMVAFAGYPLVVEDRLVGVVAMFARQTLSEQTLRALASVANTVALGIERKQSEEALRESEASFRQLAESVPQFIWVKEVDGSLSYVNKQWLEFSDLTLNQTNDWQIFSQVFHPDDLHRLASEWKKSLSGGETLEIELRMRNLRGEYRWFLTRSRPIKNADGEILKWFGTSTDITDGKQAENRLALLAEISEMTRTFEDPTELLFAVSQVLGEHLEVRRCLFNEIDFERDRETVHRDYCRGVESVAGVHRISDYSSATSAEIMAGKTVVNNDSKNDSRTAADYSKTYEPNGERSYIAVPLLRENQWVASLWVSDDMPREWSRQEISLLETVAERTWTAIEKLRINTALRESEQHLQLAIDISRISAFDIDLETDVVETDDIGREIYGWTRNEPLTFSKVQTHFHPDDRDEVARRVALAFDPEGTHEFEVEQRIIRTDGDVRWIRVRGRAFFTGAGAERRAVRCLGTYIDITNSKRAEEDLRESQEVLSLAMHSSRMGAWSRDLANETVFWSAELEEIFGLKTGTFSGNINGFYDYVYVEDKEYLAREVKNALDERRDYIVEFRFHHADGSLRWMEGRGQAVYADNGTPTKVYGIGIDITERKLAEAERERLLESEQQAREIAEEANHAKDEFIALVSHELRSPLNAMLGWTRILQEQKPDGKTTEYALDVIVRNARSQSRLIEDLLDIARVGKGKLRLELEPIELEPIISAAIEIIKPTAETKQIEISQNLDRAANFITGDVDRLRQVVENLLSNAVKFTPESGSVKVRLMRENNEAKIVISDTGQGISAEFLPQIFERFKQADPSTTRRHGGLGIGLSLARDLVELHGGTISAESAGEGMGATFTVSLPVRMVLPIAEGSTGNKVENMETEGKLSGFWILAVDDEADAREIVSFMLQINGARVTTANSAVEALEILKSSNERLPDVLLSDISMPNESGYALLEKIRALPLENGGQIPAVALTAFNRPEDRQSAFEAGFQKHLGKPVEMEDLIAAIIETAGVRQ